MTDIRTLIVEDEKPARERLRRALLESPGVTIVGEAVNGGEALSMIRSLRPDLLFLDVQMPVLDGFEVLDRLTRAPAVIFTTAYDEYALRAFDVHAVDYLLKPYTRARLTEALDRARGRLAAGTGGAGVAGLLGEYRAAHPYLIRLTVKSGRTFRVVPVSTAEYFRAEDGLVFLVDGESSHLIEESLRELEQRLEPSRFLRVHRNTIAHLNKVEKVVTLGRGRLALQFTSGARADVGRTHQEAVRRVFHLSR